MDLEEGCIKLSKVKKHSLKVKLKFIILTYESTPCIESMELKTGDKN